MPTDSSLPNHDCYPAADQAAADQAAASQTEAAVPPPRTPTGRLQPTSAFRPSVAMTHTPPNKSAEVGHRPQVLAPPQVTPPQAELPPTNADTVLETEQAAVGETSIDRDTFVATPASVEDATAPTSRARRSRRTSHGSSSRHSHSTGGRRRGMPHERDLDATGSGGLAALESQATTLPGSSMRELSGLLLAFALSVALTQASLWWVVGVDPLGTAPVISQWVPGIVPPGLQP